MTIVIKRMRMNEVFVNIKLLHVKDFNVTIRSLVQGLDILFPCVLVIHQFFRRLKPLEMVESSIQNVF